MQKLKLIILISLLPASLYAKDYFVSVTGLDNNNGAINSPLATIQHALDLCQPGDTVQIRTGSYFEKITWKNQGTVGHLITLKNYNGEIVFIDGTGKSGTTLLNITNIGYIEIKGITFQNNYIQDAMGIYVVGTGLNITIRNCTLKNIGWTNNASADPTTVNPTGQAHAVLINGRTLAGIDTVKILGCKIYDIVSGNSEAVTIAGNVDIFQIDQDTVYNTKNIGIIAAGHKSWTADAGVPDSLNQARNGTISNCVVYDNRRISNLYAPPGIYIEGARNINILNNRSYKNGNGISVGCEEAGYTASNIIIMNNQVYNNDNFGLVFGSNISTSLVKSSTVINNSFFKNGSYLSGTSEISVQNSDSNVIANNILIPKSDPYFAVSIFGYKTTNLTVDKNLMYRYSGNQFNVYFAGNPAMFTPSNTVIADPVITDTALGAPDLSIGKTSPAINAGSNNYTLILDIDAGFNYRVVNGTVDIGAFERQDGGCPAIFTIGDNQILKGKFVASQDIILNRSQMATLLSPLIWSSPLITFNSSIQQVAPLTINPGGCF